MEEIVLTEDDLRRLEKRFGSRVRLMGSWNSDGTFGYTSVPIAAVRKAAEDLATAALTVDLSSLQHVPDRTGAFLELLYGIGSPLIAAIVAAYRESSAGRIRNGPTATVSESKSLVRTAAA